MACILADVTSLAPYPRQSLGFAFGRALHRWGVPQARLAGYLGVGQDVLAALALCPVPDGVDTDQQLAALAVRFGVEPSRLAFLCRAARLEPHRLRG